MPSNVEASPNQAGTVGAPPRPQRLGLVLGLLVTAQFMAVMDFSIVQIALPTIRASLSMSLADLQWIVSAYGLTFAGFLLLSGRLSDIYGRKLLFLVGLLVFSLSSLSAGLSATEGELIAARVVQGLGAAVMSATGLALIVRTFAPIGRLNQALGIFTAVSSAGFTAGVIFGGLLTQELSWRWIFFVNVPIGAAVVLLAAFVLVDPQGKGPRKHLDFPGAVSVTGGLMLLVYGLSELGNGPPTVSTYAAFGLAALALALFLLIERRSAAPLIPLAFLRRRTIFIANAIALLTFGTTVPMVFLLTTYLQVLQGYTPIYAAAAFVPGALVYFFLGGFAAPRLVGRFGPKPILVPAMVCLFSGMLLFSRLSGSPSYATEILPAILIASIGGALSLTASNIAALQGAAQGEEGVASGLINTSRQVGGPIGLAVAVSVLDVVTNGLGVADIAKLPQAFSYAFAAAAGFALVAVAASLLLRGRPRVTADPGGPVNAPAPRPRLTKAESA